MLESAPSRASVPHQRENYKTVLAAAAGIAATIGAIFYHSENKPHTPPSFDQPKVVLAHESDSERFLKDKIGTWVVAEFDHVVLENNTLRELFTAAARQERRTLKQLLDDPNRKQFKELPEVVNVIYERYHKSEYLLELIFLPEGNEITSPTHNELRAAIRTEITRVLLTILRDAQSDGVIM